MTASATHPGSEQRTVVVGAGIVGVCCALALRRKGLSVTLIDMNPPGEQASFGHAGVIGTPYIFPAASPAALRNLPRMIIDGNHPFVLRLWAVPRLVPWFLRFARASTSADVARSVAAAVALQKHNRADWDEVLAFAGAQHLVRWDGMLEICETAASLAAARLGWQATRDRGFEIRELSPREIRELEPALTAAIAGGALLKDAGHTIDPLALTHALLARFIEMGGIFVRDRVAGVVPQSSGIEIVGRSATYRAARVVIATGVDGPRLANELGNRTPVAAERGYHIMFASPGIDLKRPVTAVDRKVVMSSLATGLRMTSMAEFASPTAAADHERAARVFRTARHLLPDLAADVTSRWVGSRPATPDSMPVIGRSPRHPNVFFAFGHGGKGLTNAATTGRLIASLAVSGS